MTLRDFIQIYSGDSYIQALGDLIRPNEKQQISIKGFSGSLDAVIATAIYELQHQNYLFILHDKEEAAYFFNDLENLLPSREVFLYPESFKRPYEIHEIENANVLFRAEILNRINHKDVKGELIVTYPEALAEKVINKRSLLQHTHSIQIGDEMDIKRLNDLLISFDFEKTDFVYEAGQFSIRGGIIDIFSYAHELPYRIELFGKEVESIRTFNPDSQLSIDPVREIHLIPNVQTRLQAASHDSFLSFLPRNTKIWIKDYNLTLEVMKE